LGHRYLLGVYFLFIGIHPLVSRFILFSGTNKKTSDGWIPVKKENNNPQKDKKNERVGLSFLLNGLFSPFISAQKKGRAEMGER